MDYLTNYYKNLSEQLQEQINLIEAGLKKALSSGNPELMKKELAKRLAQCLNPDLNVIHQLTLEVYQWIF